MQSAWPKAVVPLRGESPKEGLTKQAKAQRLAKKPEVGHYEEQAVALLVTTEDCPSLVTEIYSEENLLLLLHEAAIHRDFWRSLEDE